MTNLEANKEKIGYDTCLCIIAHVCRYGTSCSDKRCSDCEFYRKSSECIKEVLEEHKEPIKLKQWEKDLIEAYQEQLGVDHAFCSNYILEELKERGHFKGVMDTSMNTQIILENCEVDDR